MTTLALIQTLLPTIALIAIYIYHFIFHLLPLKQQQMLERFAPQAVGMVQQVAASIPDHDKKAFAINTVKMLIKDCKGPMPSDDAIGVCIESAVFALKQANANNPLTPMPNYPGTPAVRPLGMPSVNPQGAP